ncbi:MAG: CYTH domain-containing protein [Candidatus Marinimicrobia bacterium]|nr:CYTH domain-containing protein [Candidatus Neomarinimicrobiota bacterium]
MGKEIERKFLVKESNWQKSSKGSLIQQGYIVIRKEKVVRIRIMNDKGYLTIKGTTTGATRNEYEYEIPLEDARQMLNNLCEKPILEKHRYKINQGGMTWEIDIFHGDNEGLIVAEIELEYEDQEFEKPDWVDMEVTDDPKYFNSNLVKNPFKKWNV